jgi:hypothetical protein
MNANANSLVVFVLIFIVIFLVIGGIGGAALNKSTLFNPPARQEDCACTATARANTQAALDITATMGIERLKQTLVPAQLSAVPHEQTLQAYRERQPGTRERPDLFLFDPQMMGQIASAGMCCMGPLTLIVFAFMFTIWRVTRL